MAKKSEPTKPTEAPAPSPKEWVPPREAGEFVLPRDNPQPAPPAQKA